MTPINYSATGIFHFRAGVNTTIVWQSRKKPFKSESKADCQCGFTSNIDRNLGTFCIPSEVMKRIQMVKLEHAKNSLPAKTLFTSNQKQTRIDFSIMMKCSAPFMHTILMECTNCEREST